MLQAVVVSIDPRRVYLVHPNDAEFKAVRVKNPGNWHIVRFDVKFVWSFNIYSKQLRVKLKVHD